MPEVERFVAEDSDEIIWLRINRLKSFKLCESLLKNKVSNLQKSDIHEDIIRRKAVGLSSAIESAIGYWNVKTDNLNARILSRYYALLQMTIAEQVSSISNKDDLVEIQRHTEFGHGLGTVRNSSTIFPDNYFIFALTQGHFHSYAKFLGYEIDSFAFTKRPRDFNRIEEKKNLASLSDLFRRIPELQPIIFEHLQKPPLSFHIGHSQKNTEISAEKAKEHMRKTGKFVLSAPVTEKERITYIAIYPADKSTNLDFVHNLALPFTDIEEAQDKFNKKKFFEGKFKHPSANYWYDYLKIYKSKYCGSSHIIPLFGIIDDPIILHFMLMYGLSIIVRYLPDLWYEITEGENNHIGSLIEFYLSVFDHVLPQQMLERITEKRIKVYAPDGLFGPI